MQQAVQTTKISRTLDLAYMALGAVVIAVCSWISIPAAVPFTMQTFAVFFVLLFLGGRRGTGSILVYVLLGAVGMPVFAQFASGVGVLLGSTGGYIAGFILTGLLYWLVTEVFGRRLWVKIAALFLGLAVLYAFGTAWFLFVYARTTGAVGIAAALGWCVIPFIIPDMIKLGLAVMLSRRLGRAVRGF